MKSDLFLCNSSLKYEDGVTIEEISEKIICLLQNIIKIKEEIEIRNIDKDRIVKYKGIYEINIYKDYIVSDLLYGSNQVLNRDVKKALLHIIDRHKEKNITENEVFTLIQNNNSGCLNGLICLNSISIEGLDQNVIIKTDKDWYKFHRCFLAKYPVNEDNFYREIKQYFPQIYFNSNVLNSLKSIDGGLEKFASIIVYNLAQLNDKFNLCIQSDLRKTLHVFSGTCGVDATLQGDARKKSKLTFDFVDEDLGIRESVCCEPHLKLKRTNLPGDSTFYSNRIYFNEGIPHIMDGKILVAHIGKHLEL